MAGKEETKGNRQSSNPIFGSRKLKLGTFCTNLSNGCAMSSVEGALEAEWPAVSRIAQLADQMEFEAIVPVGRWRGFGGKLDFNGAGFECFTFAAGLAPRTKHPALFATSHVPSIHPVMAAKQATTIDHISMGRFALNVVCGWHKTEIEMFGSELLEHDRRYDAAAEWVEIIKALWTGDTPLNYEGKFYRVHNALLKPRPIQRPHPPIMGAGASPKGQHFAAKHCDITFTNTEHRDDPEALSAAINRPRKLAYDEYGRDLKVWSHVNIIARDTEAEAQRYYQYVLDEGDQEGLNNMLNIMGLQVRSLPPEALQNLRNDFILGYAGLPLIGTKEQIVDGLAKLVKAGLDGILLGWPAYEEGATQFRDEIMPLLVQEGLR